MRIPDTVRAIIRELWARFPPDQSNDDSRRAFMRKVGEQLGWSVGLDWGYYKTQGTHGSASKDLLPYLDPMEPDGTKHGWDILVGGGGGLNLDGADLGATPNAAGWVFHPLTPVNHLGVNGVANFAAPPVPPPPSPVPDLEARVRALEAQQQALDARVTVVRAFITASVQEAVAALPPPADPSEWEAAGKVLWWGVTLPLRRRQKP